MKVTCKYCGVVDKPHKCPHNKRKTNRNRNDNKIYESQEYRGLRQEVLEDYNYCCLWSLYIDGQVREANRTHHIIEILEDDSKALEYDNLITLNQHEHEIVHKLYKINDEVKIYIQDLLRKMNETYKSGVKTPGLYKNEFLKIKKRIPPLFL